MKWVTTSGATVRLLIDGYRVIDEGSGINPYHYLMTYRTEEIENVLITGSNRAGYTISLKTNKNASRRPRNFVTQYARGYEIYRTFEEETNLSTENSSSGITIYWKPYVTVDDNGMAAIRIKKITGKSAYLFLQGIGANGRIIDKIVTISPAFSEF